MTKKNRCACLRPFFNAEIYHNGDVFTCCSSYVKYPIGNIFRDSFEEIWNGSAAQTIRGQLLLGNQAACRTELCHLADRSGKGVCGKNLTDKQLTALKTTMPYPKNVLFSYDDECNVRCMMCRRKRVRYSHNELAKLNSRIDYILPMLKNATMVAPVGGELFASRHSRLLVKQIIEKYPKIKFRISTNGLFANETMFRELGLLYTDKNKRLKSRLHQVTVSLHATTKKTYQKIVLGSNWEIVTQNLQWLSELKQRQQMVNFIMVFVLSELNYRELPDFMDWAHNLGAWPVAWEYKNWGAQNEKQARELSIVNPLHRDYYELVKVLKDKRVQKCPDKNPFSPAIIKAIREPIRERTSDEITRSKRWHKCQS